MIFSELYSAYYNAVAEILRAAVRHPLNSSGLRSIIEEKAFSESVLSIEPALSGGDWQLITKDGHPVIRHDPAMPMTLLEKRWLQSLAGDPRIRLFTDTPPDFGVEPLFTADDFYVFDRYLDGDPYEDETYIQNFRTILAAVKEKTPLRIDTKNRKGGVTRMSVLPKYIEYSEKDDKFRLIGRGHRYGDTVNIGRILSVRPYEGAFTTDFTERNRHRKEKVEFELYDRRNALERVLLHFAHFEKEAVKLEEGCYRITVSYDAEDETEMVIRLLSFGPMIRVTGPEHFTDLIKERLIKQKSCGW